MRTGQLSIFIILGLLIISGIGIFLFLSSQQKAGEYKITENLELSSKADMVKYYVEQCILHEAVDGIYLLGSQGGYIDPEYNEYLGDFDQVEWKQSGDLRIPYWYYDGIDISPSLEKLETKLGRYILVRAENCTNVEALPSLSGVEIMKPETNYQENHFNLSLEKSYINVSINAKDISIRYFFPIILRMDSSEIKVSDYQVIVPIALGENFEIAKSIVSRLSSADEDGYDLSQDCAEYSREGYTNIFPFNGRILILDYEPYFNPDYKRSFKLQYLYSGKTVYDYCSG